MKITITTTMILKQIARTVCAVLLCMTLIAPGLLVFGQVTPAKPTATPAKAADDDDDDKDSKDDKTADAKDDVKIPDVQLDALVAPIALYPDTLLGQVLVASTYPLEIVQLQQWLEKNPTLQKDQKLLADKVGKQPWDPSIQAMAALPDVVKWLAGDIQWTTDLGNAFLAQQSDVMNAVQRMRKKAQEKGSLTSGDKI